MFEAAIDIVEAAIAEIHPGVTAEAVARAGWAKQTALGTLTTAYSLALVTAFGSAEMHHR